MNLDSEKLKLVLEEYGRSLPEMPKWIGVVDHTGKFICSLGTFEVISPTHTQSDDEIAKQIHSIAEPNYQGPDALQLGNYQASIHMAGSGVIFVLNLSDLFLLTVSYHGLGDGCCIENLDKTEEAIRNFTGLIMDEIYL